MNIISADTAPTIDASYGRLQGASGQDANHGHGHLLAYGGNNTTGPISISSALSAHGGSGRMDFDSETFIAHTLRGDGFDASEDGTGRGTPLVAVLPFDTTQITSPMSRANPKYGDPCHTMSKGMHAPAIAFQERGREEGRTLEIGGDIAYALTAPGGGGRAQERNILTPTARVRRLTPTECERLMGFPDGYTAITWKKKPAADGPRYKALGNSWAVNCARWIGRRIDLVEQVPQRAALAATQAAA